MTTCCACMASGNDSYLMAAACRFALRGSIATGCGSRRGNHSPRPLADTHDGSQPASGPTGSAKVRLWAKLGMDDQALLNFPHEFRKTRGASRCSGARGFGCTWGTAGQLRCGWHSIPPRASPWGPRRTGTRRPVPGLIRHALVPVRSRVESRARLVAYRSRPALAPVYPGTVILGRTHPSQPDKRNTKAIGARDDL